MSEIKLTFDGKEYSLTYTRDSVRQMERQGFSFVGFANGEKPGFRPLAGISCITLHYGG